MGMETLNSAARAAGFAMAPSDETIIASAAPQVQSWRASEPLLTQPSSGTNPAMAPLHWLKSLFGSFGRGAPA
jgi:hypothetical protein